MDSLGGFAGAFDGTTVDNHHLVELGFGLAPFQAFVGLHPAGTHVKVEEAHASDIIVITAVASQANATAVTHPERGFVMGVLFKHAIVIDMVTGQGLVFVWGSSVFSMSGLTVRS